MDDGLIDQRDSRQAVCLCCFMCGGVCVTLVASLTKTMVPSGKGSVCRKRRRASTSLLGGEMYRP